MNSVLFLCSANYYRSRFSEIYFNHLAARAGLRWHADSRGLKTELAQNLGPISRCTVDGLAGLGIEIPAPMRYPIPASEADFRRADLVIAVKEAEHRAMMAKSFPTWVNAITYWHIDDLDCAEPEEALPCLQRAIEGLVDELLAKQKQRSLRVAG